MLHLYDVGISMPQPVTAFLRHSLALKTAMTDCLDQPTPKAVHWLRASTRRIEATLALLVDTADVPSLPKRSRKFRKSLRRIRRAASKVRDLDVHNELLAAYKNMSDATELEKKLSSSRESSVKKLQQIIQKDQDEIHRNLDKIEAILAPATDLALSGGSLAHVAQTSLAPTLRGLNPQDDDDLHSIRKACKNARYVAEIGSETSKVASRLAKRLHGVQKTTGDWHDCLLLLNEAQAFLPNGSPLTVKLHAKTGSLRRQAESKAAYLLATKRQKPPLRAPDVH
jgi:CHAD domain-containing protein